MPQPPPNSDRSEPGEDEPPEPYRLAPPDSSPGAPKSIWIPGRGEFPGEPAEDEGDEDEEDQPAPAPLDEERYQFSLLELLGLVAATALWFGLIVSLPGGRSAKVFAGLTGLLVLVGLVVLEGFGITRPIVRLAWWLALAVYLAACAAALITG
jgi:hypothetical protein